MNEEELAVIQLWQQSNEEAVSAVFHSYYPQAFHLAELSGLSFQTAQDCAQEAFKKAFEKRHQLRNLHTFPIWFHRITTRCILDVFKSTPSKKEVSLEALPAYTEIWEDPSQNQPDVVALASEEGKQLWRAIQSLPATYRIPLILRYYSDLSIQEIASVLGKREKTVSVLLHRALKQLRESSGMQSFAPSQQLETPIQTLL